MHRPSWPPIYPDLKSGSPDSIRVQADVSRADHSAILGTAANTGAVSFIIQQAIKLTADYVRANKLTYLDSEGFIQYLRERSFGSTPTHAATPSVSGRATKIRNGLAHVKNLRAESRKDAETEGGG